MEKMEEDPHGAEYLLRCKYTCWGEKQQNWGTLGQEEVEMARDKLQWSAY